MSPIARLLLASALLRCGQLVAPVGRAPVAERRLELAPEVLQLALPDRGVAHRARERPRHLEHLQAAGAGVAGADPFGRLAVERDLDAAPERELAFDLL